MSGILPLLPSSVYNHNPDGRSLRLLMFKISSKTSRVVRGRQFFKGWGREIFAWTDSPDAVQWSDIQIFGESRIYIQIFNSTFCIDRTPTTIQKRFIQQRPEYSVDCSSDALSAYPNLPCLDVPVMFIFCLLLTFPRQHQGVLL